MSKIAGTFLRAFMLNSYLVLKTTQLIEDPKLQNCLNVALCYSINSHNNSDHCIYRPIASQHIHRTASHQVESVAATENKIYASDRFIDFFYKDVFLRRKLLSKICRKIIFFISPFFVSEGVARKLFFRFCSDFREFKLFSTSSRFWSQKKIADNYFFQVKGQNFFSLKLIFLS